MAKLKFKPIPTTPDELEAWQRRCEFETHEQAAEALWVPLQTYRNWLAGRREIKPYIGLLCHYVELHGPVVRPAEGRKS